MPESVDGILCWNLFDFLDLPSAQVLASALTKILRTDGALPVLFCDDRLDRRALLEVRHPRRRLRAATSVFDDRAETERAAQPRHHPDVRGAEGRRIVSAEEQRTRIPLQKDPANAVKLVETR
jgi:hypothetical protein